jgi:hypothetical protein
LLPSVSLRKALWATARRNLTPNVTLFRLTLLIEDSHQAGGDSQMINMREKKSDRFG